MDNNHWIDIHGMILDGILEPDGVTLNCKDKKKPYQKNKNWREI